MTFSLKLKNELARTSMDKSCCIKSELAALVRTTGYINIKSFNRLQMELSTENAAVARRIFKLLKNLYDISTEVIVKKTNRLKKRNNYSIIIDEKIIQQFLQDIKLINTNEEGINILNLDFEVPRSLIKNDCCKKSYIKASFMGCGSISDPEKSYHVEFVNNKEEHSEGLCKILNSYSVKAKKICRKNYYITYVKESDQICDLINIMGAYNVLLDYENIRAVKETRNNINRIVNCETANMDKIVDTSMRQINNINILKKYKIIDTLPDNLKELAKLRVKHKNASLKELGDMLNPPLGKSGVNHRLRKIEEIAEDVLKLQKDRKKT